MVAECHSVQEDTNKISIQEHIMKNPIPLAIMVCGCFASTLFAADEKPPPADAVAAGIETRLYLRHARDWAESLYYKNQANVLASSQEAQELAAGIVRDLGRSDKALETLATQYGKGRDIGERIDRIKQHGKMIRELNVHLSAECAKPARDSTVIAEDTSQSWHELTAAEIELAGLLRSLNISGPGAGLRDSKAAQAADAPTTYGQGFRPHTAAVQLRSILENSRVISHYADAAGALPDATILEHVGEIERQLAALKKEYAKLDETYRKEMKLESTMKTVEEHQAGLEGQVDRLKKSSQTRKLNPTELKETSNYIHKTTSQSLNQLYQLMRTLGTQPVQVEDRPYSN